MKFSYNILQEYFKKELPKPEKLSDILTMHSFEIEGVEKKGNDYIFDIAVLPNRIPDAACHAGIAKEIFSILAVKGLMDKKDFKENSIDRAANLKFILPARTKNFEIKIEEKGLCPRYIGVLMDGAKVSESPQWLKERLELLGINSINNVVDAANYAMVKINQPLHVFDFDKIGDTRISNKNQNLNSKLKKQIIVRRAKKGEKITTLDNKNYDLNEDILVIADNADPLAVAGIKGGKKAEVDFNTTRILIEAANFNRSAVRHASQKLNLRTDASARFSAGLSPSLTENGISYAVSLISEFSKAKIIEASEMSFVKPALKSIKLEFSQIKKLTGTDILLKDVKNILGCLGFKFIFAKDIFKIEIPRVRQDLENAEDVIEEIARVYGYEKIAPAAPRIEILDNEDNNYLNFTKIAKNFFRGEGYSEIYSHSFIGEDDLEILDLTGRENILELENCLSPELKFLRPVLAVNLLKSASLNFKNFNEFRLFEIGKIFSSGFLNNSDNKKAGKKPDFFEGDFEKSRLGGIIASDNLTGKEMFYMGKGALSSFFEFFGVSYAVFSEISSESEKFKEIKGIFHPARSAEILIDGNLIGILGEVKEEVLKFYGIKKGRAVIFELDFSAVYKEMEEEKEFIPFSKFPSISRDLSILVPYNTKIIEAEDLIQNQGGEMLTDLDIFDIYEPESAGESEKFEDRKSLSFRLVFQSDERTLSQEEVNKIMDKTIATLEEKGWEVRK